MIYFVRSPLGPIKIGTTIRLSERLKSLAKEYGDGLEVLAVTDGSFQTETELHRKFAHLNVLNEWFEPADELLDFIVAEGKPWDGKDEVAALVPIKLGRSQHAKLKIVAAHLNRDMADILTEIMSGAIDKPWRQSLKEQCEQADRELAR